MNYDSPAELARLLEKRGLSMSKRFGQNFLINPSARERILTRLDVGPSSRVWEIGPGVGSLTHRLLGVVNHLTVFEIDRGFARYLEDTWGERDDFELVEGDFRQTWRHRSDRPDRIVGNLPYNVGSLMIAELIEGGMVPSLMVVTVQKEVAARMVARPGTKDYSSFTLACAFGFEAEYAGDIRAGSFFPAPDVTSGIVVLRASTSYDPDLAPWYFPLVRALFSSRRKTIRNNLKVLNQHSLYRSAAEECSIDLSRRGEELDAGTVIRWARAARDRNV